MRHRKVTLKTRSSFAFCLLITSIVLSMLACSDTRPIKLGFIGGLTGKMSDLGGPARNGMLLAIEEINDRGGVDGRPIEVLIKDDKQDRSVARAAMQELINHDVEAILGPVTSAMAVNIVDMANAAEKLLVGISVTTNELSHKDDQFVRGISSNLIHSALLADYLYKEKGLRSFTGLYDAANINFSRDWLFNFAQHFESMGGQKHRLLEYHSGTADKLIALAEQLLADQPDIVVLVTNAVDSALLAKLIRQKNKQVQIAMSAWSGTERLIELGGRNVEGVTLPLYYDQDSQHPAYRNFKQDYIQRFKTRPDFGSVIAYNMTHFLIRARQHKTPDQGLKEAMIDLQTHPGLQGEIRLNPYGDAVGTDFITTIQHGAFKAQGRP